MMNLLMKKPIRASVLRSGRKGKRRADSIEQKDSEVSDQQTQREATETRIECREC
jgi:hypothetical protein